MGLGRLQPEGGTAAWAFGWAGRLAGPLRCGAEGSEAVLGFGPSRKERDGPPELGRRWKNGARVGRRKKRATA